MKEIIPLLFGLLFLFGMYHYANDPVNIKHRELKQDCYDAAYSEYKDCVLSDRKNCTDKYTIWRNECP